MLQYKVDDSVELIDHELRIQPQLYKSHADVVVDLGGASGWFGQQLKTKTNQVYNVDNHPELFTSNKITNVNSSIVNLPFDDNSVTMVLARAVLHHLSKEELKITFSEIHRILKPGGLLLIQDPGASNPFAYFIRHFFPTEAHEEDEDPFETNYLIDEVRNYFKIQDLQYHYLLSYPLPHIISRLPLKKLFRAMIGPVTKFDNILLMHKLFQRYCGYISIIGIKEKE